MTTLNLRVSSSGDDGWANPTTFSSGPLQLVHGRNSFYRFSGVSIPTGAVIEWASLLFECSKDFYILTGVGSSGHRSEIYGVRDTNPTPPTSFNNMENDYTWTTEKTVWELGDWQSGIKYETPNIGPVLQEIINQPGWNANQALMLFVEGTGNYTREAYSYEQNNNKAVRLDVDWHTPHLFKETQNTDWKDTARAFQSGLPTDPPGLANWFKLSDTLTTQAIVATAADDGEWSAGAFNSSNAALNFGRSGGVSRNQFLRFSSVNIPLSIITSGSIELGAQATGNIVNLGVFGNASATPTAPINEAQANALAKTSASGHYAVQTPNPTNIIYITNISHIIQEIVTLGGWASGNAMMLMTYALDSANSSFLSSAQHASPVGPPPKLNVAFRPIIPFGTTDTTFLGTNDGMQAAFAITTTPTVSSAYLVCDNFAHDVPSGATIHGIEVRIQKNRHIDIPQQQFAYDANIRLVRNGVIQDQDQAKTEVNWTHSDTYEYYGGSGDKWGLTDLTPADVNRANFGVAIRGYTSSVGYIDHVQMKVYYSDYGTTTGNIPLYLHGHDILNNSVTLFLETPGHATSSGNTTLYANGHEQLTDSITLFTDGVGSENSNITLHIHGLEDDFANISLYTSGPLLYPNIMSTYIKGHGESEDEISLYTQGGAYAESGIGLYTIGPLPSTGEFTNFIYGHDNSSGNIPLFLAGHIVSQDSHSLFTMGVDYGSGSMNMFIHAGTWNADNEDVPLSIYGTSPGSTGIFSSLPFFMEGSDFRGEMNMFMAGPTSETKTSSMNMFVGGIGTEVNNSIHMYIGCSGLEESVPLFIQGLTLHTSTDPFFPNAGVPDTGLLNLFLRRPITDMVSLFIMNANESDSITMYVRGGVGSESGISLYTMGEASIDSPTTLYTHGF